MRATLIRFQDQVPAATAGVLVLDSGWTCLTLERPWRDNQPNVSCITPGEYHVIPHQSPSRGLCMAVMDVPGRTHILIHSGNEVKDTEGCILVGLERIGDRLVHSRAALAELLKRAPDGFLLRVIYG